MHAGHINAGASAELGDSLLVVNLTEMSVLRERGWVFVSDEAGQMGLNFKGFDDMWPFVEGVREGTQNEGRLGFAA